MVAMALLFVMTAGTFGVRHLAALDMQPSPAATQATTSKNARQSRTDKTKNTPGKASKPNTSSDVASNNAIANLIGCGPLSPKHAGLEAAEAPQLRKLAEYETACGGSVMERLSFFVSMPATLSEAQTQAAGVAATLKEFARFNISPLVYMEPTTSSGLLDLKAYRAGQYDEVMNTYYAAIKEAGVTDSMMGVWVPFPEGNLPEWSSIDPADFAANITKTAQFQKTYFPKSQVSVLLDGATYPTTANGYNGGQYISLLPFVTGIPPGLLDGFGLQGFPWAAPADQSAENSLYDPSRYLPTRFAAEAAHALGVTHIWLNTGTFAQAYARTPSQTVNLPFQQRQIQLDGALAQAKALQNQGFQVSIHLFAENKAHTAEGIDWSYWHTSASDTAETKLLQDFVRNSREQHVALWLYDSSN